MEFYHTLMEHEDIGYARAQRDFTIGALNSDMPVEKIAEYTELTVEEINKIEALLSEKNDEDN